MVEIPFYWLDVFTSKPFKGNPAAVCIMKTDLENALYQNIAKEIGLSETAFAEKIGENEYKLRWFTPEMEMPLCGHATIATAYTAVLRDEKQVKELKPDFNRMRELLHLEPELMKIKEPE